jgi:hypothetical protein
MQPLLLLLAAAIAATPPFARVCAGRGVASPTGEPVFARLAGLPMPGWLQAFGRQEMGTAFGGYYQRVALPGGATMAILRQDGLVAAYVVQADRCVGDMVGEPLELPSANDAIWTLKRSGFKATKRFMATRAGDYGVDAEAYERVAAGFVERYVFTTTETHARHLSLAAYFPLPLRGVMDALQPEVEAGVAGWLKDHVITR